MLEFLMLPFLACLILTGIHCYLGLHVVRRGVIFVDLALAQLAAMGTAVAALNGIESHTTTAYFVSLLFTCTGAALFALTRFSKNKVPQEAMIGIVYAISSAFTILLVDRLPHGQEELHEMLVGSILFVEWHHIIKITVLYSAVGLIHYIWRDKFFALSFADKTHRQMNGKDISRSDLWWDFLFYLSFGVVVTSSVHIAGILLVFSYLMIPAVCAIFFFSSIRSRLVFGWIFAATVSLIGLFGSATFDLPTGAAIVSAFGIFWAISTIIYVLRLKSKHVI